MDSNKKTFDLILKTREVFNLYVYNFQMALTFLFRIRQKLPITFISSLRTRAYALFVIKKVRFSFVPKFTETLLLTMRARKVRFAYKVSEFLQLFTTINSGLSILLTIRERQKLVTTIYQGVLSLGLDPILAKFFLLLDYDLDILGDLDANTLGDMDYILT